MDVSCVEGIIIGKHFRSGIFTLGHGKLLWLVRASPLNCVDLISIFVRFYACSLLVWVIEFLN